MAGDPSTVATREPTSTSPTQSSSTDDNQVAPRKTKTRSEQHSTTEQYMRSESHTVTEQESDDVAGSAEGQQQGPSKKTQAWSFNLAGALKLNLSGSSSEERQG